ncbi:hypothetical protein [Streptomyces sp. S1D4-14]|uniref:beta barrel domain-containing protein n=1 Tax=Streptomyces sp. S1D4-14 TaxID=2594461 RepID=UPI001165193F|nr:hypothetical protein [Streptomyces sp. S1D4-14]QDN64477.1 hypothetical protein FNV66_01185 [Streptomyces sp. S1D4-14]
MSDKEPELGRPAKGDELMVSARDGRRTLEVRVEVLKVGRLWVDVYPLNGAYLPHYCCRFRMDTRASESGHGRIYTDEQWAWNQRRSRASEYLSEVGVRVDHGSRFHGDPLGLANAIRRGLGEDEL